MPDEEVDNQSEHQRHNVGNTWESSDMPTIGAKRFSLSDFAQILTLIVIIAVQSGIGLWWAATMTANQTAIANQLAETKIAVNTLLSRGNGQELQDSRLVNLEQRQADNIRRVQELETKFAAHQAVDDARAKAAGK
jgi:hypothetical protein